MTHKAIFWPIFTLSLTLLTPALADDDWTLRGNFSATWTVMRPGSKAVQGMASQVTGIKITKTHIIVIAKNGGAILNRDAVLEFYWRKTAPGEKHSWGREPQQKHRGNRQSDKSPRRQAEELRKRALELKKQAEQQKRRLEELRRRAQEQERRHQQHRRDLERRNQKQYKERREEYEHRRKRFKERDRRPQRQDPKQRGEQRFQRILQAAKSEKDPRKTIDLANQLIQINPRHFMGYRLRGMSLHRLGQLDRALADYNRCIELDPKDYRHYFNRGSAHAQSRRLQASLRDYQRVNQLKPDFAYGHFAKGQVLQALGRHSEARSCFKKAYKLDPKLEKKTRQYQQQRQGKPKKSLRRAI